MQITWNCPQPEQQGKYFLFATPQGGKVALDKKTKDFWYKANGVSIDSFLEPSIANAEQLKVEKTALICLEKAGLLNFEQEKHKSSERFEQCGEQDVEISVVIVYHNSGDWMEPCLNSLFQQTLQPMEIIVVDNGSSEPYRPHVSDYSHKLVVLHLAKPQSFASALNLALKQARSPYILVLNPDTALEPDVIEKLYEAINGKADVAAVVPKLRFSWARGFINGIGNYAGPFLYGIDIGLGHLDVGQFDSLVLLPSASFAGVMMSKLALSHVGFLDDGYPMYYEDLDWSYRARLLGYKILAVPDAVMYHAMGQHVHRAERFDLSPSKAYHVTYGRNRFTLKIFGGLTSFLFMLSYLAHDLLRLIWLVLNRQLGGALGLLRGNWQTALDIGEILSARALVQQQRVRTDREMLRLQAKMPKARIWRGMPVLEWQDIESLARSITSDKLPGNSIE